MNMLTTETPHFADPADRASHEEALGLEMALAAARQRLTTARVLPVTGKCHNCDEQLDQGERFCDGDCRDDYDHRMKRRAANGTSLQ